MSTILPPLPLKAPLKQREATDSNKNQAFWMPTANSEFAEQPAFKKGTTSFNSEDNSQENGFRQDKDSASQHLEDKAALEKQSLPISKEIPIQQKALKSKSIQQTAEKPRKSSNTLSVQQKPISLDPVTNKKNIKSSNLSTSQNPQTKAHAEKYTTSHSFNQPLLDEIQQASFHVSQVNALNAHVATPQGNGIIDASILNQQGAKQNKSIQNKVQLLDQNTSSSELINNFSRKTATDSSSQDNQKEQTGRDQENQNHSQALLKPLSSTSGQPIDFTITNSGQELSNGSKAVDFSSSIIRQIERLQQNPASPMRFTLDLPNGSTVQVKLQMNNGKVQPHFTTDSPAIQKELNDGWANLIQSAKKNGIQLDNPLFIKK